MNARRPVGRARTRCGATLALLALLAGGSKARAQCTAATDGEKVRLTLDLNSKIADLESIRDKIEKEHHVVIMDPLGGASMITSEQVGLAMGAAVFEGRLDPDSIPSEIARIRRATNIALRDVILPELEEARKCWAQLNGTAPPTPTTPTPSAPSAQIEWPVPMDWAAVKGIVRGSYVAECTGNPNAGWPAFRTAGTWRLELLGDGKVRGIFVDGGSEYSGIGSISAAGSASGVSRTSNAEVPLLGWTARFERSGVDLLMSSHTLDLRSAERGPRSILVDCKPGFMRQE